MTSQTHHVTADQEGRIDLVVQKLTGRSRTQVRGLFDHDCIFLEDQVCQDASLRVYAGDKIKLSYDAHRNYKEKQRYKSPIFKLVYEDEFLLLIDKSAGYLTMPNTSNDKQTVLTALNQYLSLGKIKHRKVFVVHRLDRDTSGLLVFGKSESIAQKIKSQFEARKPKREYVAIVAGHLKNPTGTFKSHLATDKDLNQHSTSDLSVGKLAITHYKTTQVLKDATVVSVTLETGRRNQIRVHFAEAGHPVLGDIRYESNLASHNRWKWKRLALHAAMLGFKHPESGKELLFQSAVPEEFRVFAQGR